MRDINKCDCRKSAVEFFPVIGEMDCFYGVLDNCTATEKGFQYIYTCNECGNDFETSDAGMVRFHEDGGLLR